MKLFGRDIDFGADELQKEGKDFIQVKALSTSLHILSGVKKLADVYLAVLLGFIFVSIAFMSAVGHLQNNYNTYGELRIDLFSMVALVIPLLCIFLFSFILLREKMWLKIFGLDKEIEKFLYKSKRKEAQIVADDDSKRLTGYIEKIVDEKIKEMNSS